MPYVLLPAKVPGDTITHPNWLQIRENFNVSAVAIATALGEIPVGDGATSLAMLTAGADNSTLVPDAGVGATGMRWQIQPAVSVWRNAAFNPAGIWTSIEFTGERWDTNGMWVIGTPAELEVPAGGAGIYHIGGNIEFDNTGAPGEINMGVRILLNGATVIAQCLASDDDDGPKTSYNVSRDYNLAVGNTLELQAYTNGGINVLSSAQYSPEFWATWLRPVP